MATAPDNASSSSAFGPLSTLPKGDDAVPPSKRRRWERLATEADRSYRAAVELKCLDCVCWVRTEARDCRATGCALWAISRRIFPQSAADEGEESSAEAGVFAEG